MQNIIVQRIQNKYEDKNFKKCDSIFPLIKNEDPDYNFRLVEATLIKWFNKYYIYLQFCQNNCHKNLSKKVLKEMIINGEDFLCEYPYIIEQIDKSKLSNFNPIKEFMV